MKIISWNINGYRSITGQNPSKKYDTISKDNKLFAFVEKYEPDVICLQETKASPEQIESSLIAPPGYQHYYSECLTKKGYSGVVTFAKNGVSNFTKGFGIEKFDNEGRIAVTEFSDFVLLNIYFPNGTSGYERVDYKLQFYDAFLEFTDKLIVQGKNVICCGDYNTAHQPIDLARPKENENVSGFLRVERDKLDNMVSRGWIDTFRQFNQESGNYTWWSQRGRARENNVGWRIDYHFVSDKLQSTVKNSYHLPNEQGSDHCPIVLELDI